VTECDTMRTQQIFWNLLRNAIKFTPTGGVVTVETWNEMAGDEEVIKISVSDTGMGICAKDLPLLFAPFKQAANARAYGGLGLGLHISKVVAKMQNATLTAQSPGEGKGSTFTLTLRSSTQVPSSSPRLGLLQKYPSSPNIYGEHDVGIASMPPECPPSIRILLIEDNLTTNLVMVKLLQRLGYVCKTAFCGEEALLAYKQSLSASRLFHVIVSDIGLPDMTGWELMKGMMKIHEEFGASTPVPKAIAMSGYGMEKDIEKSSEVGFIKHLVKPVQLRLLQSVLEDLTRSMR